MKQRMPWLFCIFFVLCLTKCGEPLPDAESAGARLYQGRCSGCHRLYHPRLLTIEMWKLSVVRMEIEFKRQGLRPLSRKEIGLILDYLDEHSLKQGAE